MDWSQSGEIAIIKKRPFPKHLEKTLLIALIIMCKDVVITYFAIISKVDAEW